MTDPTGLSSSHISPQLLAEYDAARRTHAFYGVTTPERVMVDSVRWAEGGDVVEFKRAGLKAKPPVGARRSAIEGFSTQSRHRLLKFVNSIDRRGINPDRLWFVTLTYPAIWPASPLEWKRHLQAFQKRLTRAFGKIPAIWKLEPQRRGAPHNHIILLMPEAMCVGLVIVGKAKRGKRIVTRWAGGELSNFREWLSRAWYEIVASGDEKHLRAGTNCEPLEAWGKVVAYAAKYLGKECYFHAADGSTQKVGRFWGVWRREEFPVRWDSVLLSFDKWSKLRRTIRRMNKASRMSHLRGRAKSATVFVSWSTWQRLIDWVVRPAGTLRREFDSVTDFLKAIHYGDHVNDWFHLGEKDRRAKHFNARGISPGAVRSEAAR
jgi:hypothetical protein